MAPPPEDVIYPVLPTDDPPAVNVAPFADAEREEVARRLGRYILAQLPYGVTTSFPKPIGEADTTNIVAIPDNYETEKSKTVSGLYPGATADHPYIREPFVGLPAMLDGMSQENLAELEHWSMNGVSHVITKAIRIWYTYQIEDTSPGALPGALKNVGAWLLVGYLGDGH